MPSRRRPAIALAPWRRAPLLLLRAPGVLAAIAGAAFLLTLAVSSRPVFLGSAGAAAVDSDLQDGCRYEVGLRATAGRILRRAQADAADVGALPKRTRLLTAAGPARHHGIQPVVTTIAGGNGAVANANARDTIQLVSRTGAFDHVNVKSQARAPTTSDGIWLPDTTAGVLGVDAGDTVNLSVSGSPPQPVFVAAVYEDLTYLERPKFWCSMSRTFEPLGSNPLPPVALADEQELLRLLNQANRTPPNIFWELAPADGLSLPEADEVADRLAAIDHDLRNPSDLARQFGNADGLLMHLGMDSTMAHAHQVTRQVRTTADTVGTAGTAIALVAVAGAGFFWVDRRRNEVALLLAKGVGPATIALKAALEAVLPVIAGAAAGAVAGTVVPQSLGLLEELSIRENVELPLRLARREDDQLSEQLLEGLRLAHLADRRVDEVSMGEQQRTAVARGLVMRPRLFLADEPTSHQDRVLVEEVFSHLRAAALHGATVVMATHDPSGVERADRVVHMRDGRIETWFRPERPSVVAMVDPHMVLGTPITPPYPDGLETAVFGLGCFWGAERKFWQIDGVYTTAVGYAGGDTEAPTYEQVCSGRTGHAEVVLVVFDPEKVDYEDLLRVFWESHDPTQGMRQGNDVGTQYRSAVYYADDVQREKAEASKEMYQKVISDAGYGAITTEIAPAGPFYFAEDYHQQYLAKNPNGYCGLGGTGVSCPL